MKIHTESQKLYSTKATFIGCLCNPLKRHVISGRSTKQKVQDEEKKKNTVRGTRTSFRSGRLAAFIHPPGLARTKGPSDLIDLTHSSALNTLCSILLHVQIMWHSQRDELTAITGSTGMECTRFFLEA